MVELGAAIVEASKTVIEATVTKEIIASEVVKNEVIKDAVEGMAKEIGVDSLQKMPSEIGVKDIKSDSSVVEKEQPEKKGGSYNDVKKESNGESNEVHHIPADSASRIERGDGPAILMEKDDHRKTASCGNSKEAREYREKQKDLIDSGRFREAVQMDIDDIKSKFGNKYDDAISQMMDYIDKIESEGKI